MIKVHEENLVPMVDFIIKMLQNPNFSTGDMKTRQLILIKHHTQALLMSLKTREE
jgi:hypothetical protein